MAAELIFLLVLTEIVCDLVEIQLNLSGNGLKVLGDIEDPIALEVLDNSTSQVVAQIISWLALFREYSCTLGSTSEVRNGFSL